MRAPDFWFKSGDWRATLLRPVAALYGTIAAFRMNRSGFQASVPVICIGNFTAGGAGKTPTAMAIAALLKELGETPVFLTRGYGGFLKGPHRVDPARDDAAAVGDEALLLARVAPVVKSADRVQGARVASDIGSVIVMDDGLQNPTLEKDFSIAVVDGESGIGNGLCLPAGPLRAPLVAQKRRTDAVLLMGADGPLAALSPLMNPRPFWHATLVPDAAALAALRGRRLFAFAGIGRPDKFFSMLEREGLVLAERRAFADHAPYHQDTLVAIAQHCQREGLVPVTTEKDAVRIGPLLQETSGLASLQVVPVTFHSPDRDTIKAALVNRLAHRRL